MAYIVQWDYTFYKWAFASIYKWYESGISGHNCINDHF